jgi:hypothetical protein
MANARRTLYTFLEPLGAQVPLATQIRSDGPSLEALLGFVAVSNVQQGDEVLRQLLLHCLVVFPSESAHGSADCCSILTTVFGLKIGLPRVQSALDELVAQGQVTQLPGSAHYRVNAVFRGRIEARIESAKVLQERVKNNWLQQCNPRFPDLDREQAWTCLQQYLGKLFRRHGLQTVQLLDSRADGDDDNTALLKSALDNVLSDGCDDETQRMAVAGSIHLFVSTVGTDLDRTNFIVQLADGAFSYYSLSAPPEVAARLRSKLKELTLFLDTNFLFGLLGLHVNPFDAVSEELISAIVDHNLPFTLRYHEATLVEMRRTIIGITSHLKGRHWPQALSRAAAKAPYVSSIERKFHETNAIQTIDPETFFDPYDHPDVLLRDHGILIFRQPIDRLQERSDLINQYQEFLKLRHREKPYEAVDHDMTVLDCVRHQRSKSMSSLDAKALIITCDTILSRFDWQELRSGKQMACTVLPNQFLQLLRPFVPSSPEFDRSFAESFAIAEFRTISASADASSKLLSLLVTYKDIKEETASSLLANDLLLDKLKKSKDDKQFKEFVDAALIAENATLLEEVVALKEQAQQEKVIRTQKDIEEVRLRRELESERDALSAAHEEATRKASELSEQLRIHQTEAANSISQLQANASEAENEVTAYRKTLNWISLVTASLCSLAGITITEILVHRFNWQWLLMHPNSYSLRVLVYLAMILFCFGLFRASWRKSLWWGSIGVVALFVLVLGLLGGPPPPR